MMNPEAFEMREQHRHLLARHRVYLLHNLRPTEQLWSTLIAKGIFSMDMVADIKSCQLTSEKIGRLLDLLPARGPSAFDDFCDALLECDHAHVADYLKTLEATDHFRRGIQPHCIDVSDHMLDRLVNIFKKSTPTVQRFAERKFSLILEEQEHDLHQREAEVKDLTSKNTLLQLEVSQLRSFMNSCTETMDTLCQELQRDFLSVYFLREERKHLDNLKDRMEGIGGFERVLEFYDNMQNLMRFLEAFAGIKIRDTQNNNATDNDNPLESNNNDPVANTRSMHDKMQGLVNAIVDLCDEVSSKTTVSSLVIRGELDKILKRVQEIIGDVFQIKDVFKNSLRQKRKLEAEVLSMLHSFQEMRRLEREVKEKHSHIVELNKQGQIMKKKTKHHRKHLEQIQLNVEQKKIQVREIQSILERHISSADQRLHSLLNLLPDLNENQNENVTRSDTDLTGDTSDASRMGTPATDRLSAMTPLNRQREVTNLNLEMEAMPSAGTPRPTKVRFETDPAADQEVTLTKIMPQDGVGAKSKPITPRAKPGLLKQRSNLSRAILSSRRTSRTPNDRVKLRCVDPANSRNKSSNANAAVKPPPKPPEKKPSPEDDIDKWVNEQQKCGRTQAIQRKLALYQVQSDKSKENDQEKQQMIREALAKSDQKMSNLGKKPPPEEPVTAPPIDDSPANQDTKGVIVTAIGNTHLSPDLTSSTRPNSDLRKVSQSLSSSSTNSRSHASHSSNDNGDAPTRESEAETSRSNVFSRLQRPSRHSTMLESERGTASMTRISAETMNLPPQGQGQGQGQLRQSYSQMFNNHQDQHHVKKQENRQPLVTKQIMIRLPSK